MILSKTKTDWEIVTAYINENSDKINGMTMLLGAWDCKDNNADGDLFDWDEQAQPKNQSNYQFDFDDINFLELMEALEEVVASIVIQIVHNEQFIQSAVEMNKRPMPVDSFLQIQKHIRKYMEQKYDAKIVEPVKVIGW